MSDASLLLKSKDDDDDGRRIAVILSVNVEGNNEFIDGFGSVFRLLWCIVD